jgi:hypothetical protein
VINEDTAERLRRALTDHCADSGEEWQAVREALDAAAAAARSADMSAERFVIWLKGMWEDVMERGPLERNSDHAHERDAVISAAIKAYYLQ